MKLSFDSIKKFKESCQRRNKESENILIYKNSQVWNCQTAEYERPKNWKPWSKLSKKQQDKIKTNNISVRNFYDEN